MLEIRLLGKFEIKEDNQVIRLTSRPAQSLLAYLILSEGTSHRREKLAGMLWPDSLEETARNNLRHALWQIRKALPSRPGAEFLLTDDLAIAFNTSAEYWLDVAQLEKLDESGAADVLMVALQVYQGELLPGFYEDWVLLAREHLASRFEHHMARLLSLLQEEKRWLDVLEWSERWIKLGQKPEPAYRALMSAHAARGDMSKVVTTYERCVKSLQEFGFDPSEQTRALYERIKSGRDASVATSLPASEKQEGKRTNLPVPLTSFIGRENEVKDILHLLNRNRLVTLLGSGGVGKTRLAIEASHQVLDKFRDGAWWIDLAGLNDELLVPGEVARVLDLAESPGQPVTDLLVSRLASKQMLLVLDNCEHLISACVRLADRLLSNCSDLKILATSREVLDLFGEAAWQVPSLSLPDMDLPVDELEKYEGVRLFLERAQVCQPQFALTTQTARPVVQICRRLGGMPLAIELAAARVRVMSVEEIVSRLDDRFSLLTSGSRAALPRHQTLRATIDWSFDLLSDSERILFRRMGVFAGGFTLPGVEAVCGSQELERRKILDLLGRLVDKSLLVVEQTSNSTTRYRMQETIHAYAGQKLMESGESNDLRNRHLNYYVGLAEQAEQITLGPESGKFHRLLDDELDEVRMAMEWAIHSHQTALAFRLSAALYYFWYNRRKPGNDWQTRLEDILPLLEDMERSQTSAKALNAMGFLYWADVVPADLGKASSNELNDKRITAQSLCNLGLIGITEGRYRDAYFFFKRSLELFEELGLRNREYILSLTFLGDVVFSLNDLEEAQNYYEKSIHVLRRLDDRPFLAYAVRRLAQLLWYCGEFGTATWLCRESLAINRELNHFRGMVAGISGCGCIATAQKNFDRAAQLFGAVETLLASRNTRLVYMDRLENERNLSIMKEHMDSVHLETALKKGELMTLEETIEFALQES